ncbi:hypothetical protein CY0110_16262 [Crocosphaera chwakensis CCY0110]|uniref:Uncharacterized protein n=1 Tax=Crocosphaera chwakensis CCY0110 TaxID=391612 RepID=A3IHT4_9CHRO|nr:hypothetical protein CY0110_16262 [Crocosphaera chwakensis CCY0110]
MWAFLSFLVSLEPVPLLKLLVNLSKSMSLYGV